MKTVIHAALFCSVLLGMGSLFGIVATLFAQSYASKRVKASRENRREYKDTGNILFDYDGKAT